MNFARLLELSLVILVIATLVTQVAWPLIRGTKLFPIFRREAKLEKQLDEKRQEELEKSLERQLDRGKRSK